MKQSMMQTIGTFLLGILVPCMIFPRKQQEQPPQITETTQPTQITTGAPEEAAPMMITVLDGAGELVVMELEDYVFGVVLAEMPAAFEPEALQAQAVASRTYALKQAEANKHPEGAVCMDSGCCQAYISPQDYVAQVSTQAYADKVAAAVAATAGQVLLYDRALAETTYFSCSGGMTEAAEAVWGKDYPYLQAVQSPGEEWAEGFASQRYFTVAELCGRLGLTLRDGERFRFTRISDTPGGSVAQMEICGQIFTGTQLRQLLELPSTMFEFYEDAYGITVLSKGKGHRVGMSQYGADAMALQGNDYAQILSYYYKGTQLAQYE